MIVAHFFLVCLDFKFFFITFKFKYSIFCLFYFFQITQPTETYKKRVKIKKLVSKIFQKKFQVKILQLRLSFSKKNVKKGQQQKENKIMQKKNTKSKLSQ